MSSRYEKMKSSELWALIRGKWETTTATYSQLEKEFGIRRTTIRSRRTREGWERSDNPQEIVVEETGEDINERNAQRHKKLHGDTRIKEVIHVKGEDAIHVKVPHPTAVTPDNRAVSRREIDDVDLDDGLTDVERIFCLEYMRCFNITKAYQKAYGCSRAIASSRSYSMMKKPHIIAQLDRLKKEQVVALKLDARDILQQWIDIAFADITDFAEFGMIKEPILDKKGKETGKFTERPYMRFKDSTDIDGMVVSEVKLGKDGIGVKMHDKIKALEVLTKHYNVLDESTQQKLQIEKLKLENKMLASEVGTAEEGAGGKTIILSGEDQMKAYIAEQKAKKI